MIDLVTHWALVAFVVMGIALGTLASLWNWHYDRQRRRRRYIRRVR